MLKITSRCPVVVVLASAVACHRIDDDDLVGRYQFERDSVHVDLEINRDHTYTETATDGKEVMKATGPWKYVVGPRDLFLLNVWVPVIPLGSERVQLRKDELRGFHVDPCGGKVCLSFDDDNELQFVGK
jgi:hypothetical protein